MQEHICFFDAIHVLDWLRFSYLREPPTIKKHTRCAFGSSSCTTPTMLDVACHACLCANLPFFTFRYPLFSILGTHARTRTRTIKCSSDPCPTRGAELHGCGRCTWPLVAGAAEEHTRCTCDRGADCPEIPVCASSKAFVCMHAMYVMYVLLARYRLSCVLEPRRFTLLGTNRLIISRAE